MPAAVAKDIVVVGSRTNGDLVLMVGVVISQDWVDWDIRKDPQQLLGDIPDQCKYLGQSELGLRHM